MKMSNQYTMINELMIYYNKWIYNYIPLWYTVFGSIPSGTLIGSGSLGPINTGNEVLEIPVPTIALPDY